MSWRMQLSYAATASAIFLYTMRYTLALIINEDCL